MLSTAETELLGMAILRTSVVGSTMRKFYKWAKAQPFDIYISEYSMPDDFRIVAEFPKRGFFSATTNSARVEKVYCNH